MQRINLFLALYHNTPHIHIVFTGPFIPMLHPQVQRKYSTTHCTFPFLFPLFPFSFFFLLAFPFFEPFLTTGWLYFFRLVLSNLLILVTGIGGFAHHGTARDIGVCMFSAQGSIGGCQKDPWARAVRRLGTW